MKGVIGMAQTNVNVRMDEELKTEFDDFCKSIGLTMSAAICVYAKRVVAEQKIPFELTAPNKNHFPSDKMKSM